MQNIDKNGPIASLVKAHCEKNDVISHKAAGIKAQLVDEIVLDILAIVNKITSGEVVFDEYSWCELNRVKARITDRGLLVLIDYSRYHNRIVNVLGQDIGVYSHFNDKEGIATEIAAKVSDGGDYLCGSEGIALPSREFVFLVSDR